MPSEILRDLISKTIDFPINNYKWDSKLQETILNTKTDPDLEEHVPSLKEAYENGYNIGHCNTTSRYLSRIFNNSLLHYGIFELIKGTKSSPKGEHAWVELDGYLIDPTLMIIIPVSLKETLGYHTEKIIAKSSSLVLSEYDLYGHEYQHKLDNPKEYETSLYQISSKPLKKDIK